MWYPNNPQELKEMLEEFLKSKDNKKIPSKINGIIVPHAGYIYSGRVAGSAYSLLKNNPIENAIIIGPSHYTYTHEPITSSSKSLKTPLGEIELFNLDFKTDNIDKEHSINNQIPFLQALGIKKILPLMIGDITNIQAKDIAEKLSKINEIDNNTIYIFSTDLSHFLPYEDAKAIDKKTIEIIKNLNKKDFKNIEACGIYPLAILFHLCQILKTKPKLIEYKNSGDVTGDKKQVVGYASFWF
jgi:AmmeMemoRadiSam system protein B